MVVFVLFLGSADIYIALENETMKPVLMQSWTVGQPIYISTSMA